MYTFRKLVTISSKRFFTNTTPSKRFLEELTERSLLRLSGHDVSDFLQGLITNDIKHLQNSPGSMYTMLLNSKGRVLYDTIVYRISEENTYLMECDNLAVEPILKHFKIYRVRRKIDMHLSDNLKVYALFDTNSINLVSQTDDQKFSELVTPCDKLNSTESSNFSKTHKDVQIFNDPRVSYLGSRLIADKRVNVKEQISDIYPISESKAGEYRWFRYKLGVGEGVSDLPPGNCFPLECNCDYMHGVSFHKGCYIGQELTARTYHTGVVRKRFMPLYFTKIPTNIPVDNAIVHEGNRLGKLRGIEKDVGLGLLRISQALEFNEITVGNGSAKVVKPSWWPIELPKKKVSQKT